MQIKRMHHQYVTWLVAEKKNISMNTENQEKSDHSILECRSSERNRLRLAYKLAYFSFPAIFSGK